MWSLIFLHFSQQEELQDQVLRHIIRCFRAVGHQGLSSKVKGVVQEGVYCSIGGRGVLWSHIAAASAEKQEWKLNPSEKKAQSSQQQQQQHTNTSLQLPHYPACSRQKHKKQNGKEAMKCQFNHEIVQCGTWYVSIFSMSSVWRKPFCRLSHWFVNHFYAAAVIRAVSEWAAIMDFVCMCMW